MTEKPATVWRHTPPWGAGGYTDFFKEADALKNMDRWGGTVTEVPRVSHRSYGQTRWGFDYGNGTHVSFPDQAQAEEHAAAAGAVVYEIKPGENACDHFQEQQ